MQLHRHLLVLSASLFFLYPCQRTLGFGAEKTQAERITFVDEILGPKHGDPTFAGMGKIYGVVPKYVAALKAKGKWQTLDSDMRDAVVLKRFMVHKKQVTESAIGQLAMHKVGRIVGIVFTFTMMIVLVRYKTGFLEKIHAWSPSIIANAVKAVWVKVVNGIWGFIRYFLSLNPSHPSLPMELTTGTLKLLSLIFMMFVILISWGWYVESLPEYKLAKGWLFNSFQLGQVDDLEDLVGLAVLALFLWVFNRLLASFLIIYYIFKDLWKMYHFDMATYHDALWKLEKQVVSALPYMEIDVIAYLMQKIATYRKLEQDLAAIQQDMQMVLDLPTHKHIPLSNVPSKVEKAYRHYPKKVRQGLKSYLFNVTNSLEDAYITPEEGESQVSQRNKPLLLHGIPGTGKSYAARPLPKLFDDRVAVITVTLDNLDRLLGDAEHPGLLVTLLHNEQERRRSKQLPKAERFFIVIDEVGRILNSDKKTLIQALQFFDRDTTHHLLPYFNVNLLLEEIEIICTANEAPQDAAIIDRMIILECDGFDREAKRDIMYNIWLPNFIKRYQKKGYHFDNRKQLLAIIDQCIQEEPSGRGGIRSLEERVTNALNELLMAQLERQQEAA